MASCMYFWFMMVWLLCMLIWNGIELWSIGVPSGRVMFCTRAIPGMWKMPRAMRSSTSMSAGLRRS